MANVYEYVRRHKVIITLIIVLVILLYLSGVWIHHLFMLREIEPKRPLHLPISPPKLVLHLSRDDIPQKIPSLNKSHEIHDWKTLYNHVVEFLREIGLSTENFTIIVVNLREYTWDIFGFKDNSTFCYLWQTTISYRGGKFDYIIVEFESLSGTITYVRFTKEFYNLIDRERWIVANKTRFLDFTKRQNITRYNYTRYLNKLFNTLSLRRPWLYNRFSYILLFSSLNADVFKALLNNRTIFGAGRLLPETPLSTASIVYHYGGKYASKIITIRFPIGLLIHIKNVYRNPSINKDEAVEKAREFLYSIYLLDDKRIILDDVSETYYFVKPWYISNFWCVVFAISNGETHYAIIYIDPVNGKVYDYAIIF